MGKNRLMAAMIVAGAAVAAIMYQAGASGQADMIAGAPRTGTETINASQITPASPTPEMTDTGLKLPADINLTQRGTVALTENSLTNYFVARGQTTTFKGTVVNFNYNQPKVITVWVGIFDANNRLVKSTAWEKVAVDPFAGTQVQMTTSGNLAPGDYYFDVGIYNAENGELISWFSRYQNFTVAGS